MPQNIHHSLDLHTFEPIVLHTLPEDIF